MSRADHIADEAAAIVVAVDRFRIAHGGERSDVLNLCRVATWEIILPYVDVDALPLTEDGVVGACAIILAEAEVRAIDAHLRHPSSSTAVGEPGTPDEPLLGPRQGALIDAFTVRLGSGPPLSQEDLDALHATMRTLGLGT